MPQRKPLPLGTATGIGPGTLSKVINSWLPQLPSTPSIGPEPPKQLGAAPDDFGLLRGLWKGPQSLQKMGSLFEEAQSRRKIQEFLYKLYHGTDASFLEPNTGVAMGRDWGFHATESAATASRVADRSGGNVIPIWARIKKALELPDMGMWKDPMHWTDRLSTYPLPADPNMRPRGYPYIEDDIIKELLDISRHHQRTRVGTTSNPGVQLVYDPAAHRPFTQDVITALQHKGIDAIKYPNFVEGLGEPSYLFWDPRQLRGQFAEFSHAGFGKSKNLLAGLGGAAVAGTAASTTKRKKPKDGT